MRRRPHDRIFSVNLADRMTLVVRFFIVLAMLVGPSATAWSQPKTDVVTLSNGDRITGEVTKLDRGRLEFKTDDAGTIEIEWDNVARLEASRQFDIGLSDGRRLLGSLGPTTVTVRMLRIATVDMEESIPMLDVTSLAPIGARFWAKLDGSINAGFSYTRSSGIAQTTLNSDTEFRRPAFVARFSASATLTENDDDEERDDRANIDLSYIRYRGNRWFVAAGGTMETNESLGLLLRTQGGATVGQRLVNTNSSQLELSGGMVVNEERGVDTEPTAEPRSALQLQNVALFVRRGQDRARPPVQVLSEPQQLGPAAPSTRRQHLDRGVEGSALRPRCVRHVRQRTARR